MFGLILVIIGVFFLLKNAGIIDENFWGYLWPILIIFLGLSMVDKDKKKKENGGCLWWCNHKSKSKDHPIVDEK